MDPWIKQTHFPVLRTSLLRYNSLINSNIVHIEHKVPEQTSVANDDQITDADDLITVTIEEITTTLELNDTEIPLVGKNEIW